MLLPIMLRILSRHSYCSYSPPMHSVIFRFISTHQVVVYMPDWEYMIPCSISLPMWRPSVLEWLRLWALFSLSPGRKRSEEHTSELQSRENLVCRLLLEK